MSEMNREKALEVMNILRFGKFEEIINTHEIVNNALDVAIEALKEQRPHGVWKEVCDFDGNHYKWECSVCGRLEEFEEDFCNCGADMRKEGKAE